MAIKQIVKMFIPPILWNVKKYLCQESQLYYFGDFDTFKEAEKKCDCMRGGYNAQNILNQVDEATQKVRRGEALYEQDGVCFYEPCVNYELLSALLYVKSMVGEISVLDFGGALGSTYFRYRRLLDDIKAKWCVVEQKHFIDCGRKKVPEIPFYYNMDEALASDSKPNVLLLSGVLQYLDEPYIWFDDMLSRGFDYIILDETCFQKNEKAPNKVMLQHVPSSIYKAVYPVNLLSHEKLREKITSLGYEVVWEWIYRGGQIPIKKGWIFKDTVDKGLLLKKK